MYSKLVALLALATPLLAITITSPASFESFDISKDIPIVWTTVSTDPSVVNIELVNFASYPTVTQTLGTGVSTSAGRFVISGGDLSVTGVAFQINFIGTTAQNNGILAQSGQFNLTQGSTTTSSSSASTSSSSSTPTTTASTTATIVPPLITASSTFSTFSTAPYTYTNTTVTSASAIVGTGAVTTTTGTSSAGSSTVSATPYEGAASNVKIGTAGALVGGAAAAAAAVFALFV